MRQFPLKVGGGATLNFDTDGRVLDSADNVVGLWSTNAANKIQLRRAGGGAAEEIEVGWLFNADNQLVITQAGKPVFTILETDSLPRFELRKNQLVVDSDGDSNFEFTLKCLFGMNADGNLVVSINGKESVIDGFIEDKRSLFRFHFKDKTGGSFPNSLIFSGQWERKAAVDDAIQLHFALDDPALEIAAKPLNLPQVVRIDPARNHLALVYQSKSHGERRLQFLGSLEIKPNFTLVFRIDDVKDAGLRKSTITVETSFAFDAAKGNLQLSVGKKRSANSQVVEVGGALQVKLKNNTSLDWSFAYAKSTAGAKTTVTIATALTFEFKDNKFFINYQQDGTTKRLEVSGKIKQEDFTVGFGATIVNDPQGRSLRAFIGVSF